MSKTQKRKLDTIFSKYIRLRKADKNGYATCVTCGKRNHWKKMHNGHYVDRRHMATRFDEKNCNVQCPGCNTFREGAKDEYTLYLINEYGNDVLLELNEAKHSVCKWSKQDYQNAIDYYTEEVRYLEKGERKCPYCSKYFKNVEAHLTKSDCE